MSGERVPRPLAHVVASLFGECAQITVARDVLQRDDPMIIMQLLVYNSVCNAMLVCVAPNHIVDGIVVLNPEMLCVM